MVITLEPEGKAGCASAVCSQIQVPGSIVVPKVARLIPWRMGCCGCGDDASTKVDPRTAEQHDSPFNETEVFARKRSCTDLPALLILILLLGGYSFFVNNAVKKGDPYRIINGYDNCANVCGRKTLKETNPEFSCKGADMTSRPYLNGKLEADGTFSRTCVTKCENTTNEIHFLNRCLPKKLTDSTSSILSRLGLQNFFNEAASDLNIAWRELIYLLLIAFAISIFILVAFRYIVQYVIYIVLCGAVVVSIGGTICLWLLWYEEKNRSIPHAEDAHTTSYFIYSILMTIVAVMTLLIVLVMRKRIALVAQLFREAGKAVYSMPALLLQPIYTYIFIGLSFVGWVYCILWIESAGDLYKKQKNGHLHYSKDAILHVARWYNMFIFFVMVEFCLGCQHMVVAGAVARWFFTRDKKQLSLPVTRSTYSVIRYHIGTIAFGAMIIGVVRLLRSMIAFVQNRLKHYDNSCVKGLLWCCQCCMWCFESILKFLTRNAYIETAIYGCSFCTGGKKAFRALSDNILRVAAINSVGDFVLFLGKVLVVALTVVAGVYLIQKEGLHYPWIPITLGGLFALIISHCFISIYEMIIDTIFICFCEDCVRNDGISRPYYMSKGLMEFVENSKKALKQLDAQPSNAR
ncbi:choline transporter-like protein 1 isoform X2 [Chelonus insularis]|uniref:choline transporter-like protein 1 isoform X2 n=1 Tax=Chelonus insularis TaxID=460826 RepID=UPI00158924E8|nr:choline transporter-like protein 1 isoform X2 [Chelonus insularis]